MSKSKSTSVLEPVNGELPEISPIETIVIQRIKPKIIEVEIVGTSPLVVCRWSEKAKREILDKQMKKAKQAKEARSPEDEYKAALYVDVKEGWTGVPAVGMKGALVNACRAVDGLPMTVAKRVFFVVGQGKTADGVDIIRINGKHHMWENPVRIDNGKTASLAFRPRYEEWSMKFMIEMLSNMISPEQVVNLVELAGFIEGLCEWRPGAPKSNTGSFGRFKLKRE